MDSRSQAPNICLDRPVLEVAPDLLGCVLIRRTDSGITTARIVETEAYREDDPASHSYNGVTERSRIMFGPPGHWYIYKCYGIHWMINVVCNETDRGEAVLIRAAEPLEGESLMEARRSRSGTTLSNGPGKLAEALDVTDRFNGTNIGESDSFTLRSGPTPSTIKRSPRIGITDGLDKKWRFYCDNSYVSER